MATLSITVPDDLRTRIEDGFAGHHGYQDQVRNPDYDPEDEENFPRYIDNPQNKTQFLKAQVIEYIKKSVLSYEKSVAIAIARDSVSEVGGLE